MIEEKRKLFIRRERIRRNLMNTKTGETICLQDWEIQMVLDWIKELEREVKRNGYQIGKAASGKSKDGNHGRW